MHENQPPTISMQEVRNHCAERVRIGVQGGGQKYSENKNVVIQSKPRNDICKSRKRLRARTVAELAQKNASIMHHCKSVVLSRDKNSALVISEEFEPRDTVL